MASCVFAAIAILSIILYNTGLFSKGSESAKSGGYRIAPDKSRNIGPGEIKDYQTSFNMIKNQNDKNKE